MESLSTAARAKFLAAHGWATYDAYLASPLWAAIGRRVKAGRLCSCGCRRPATQVHHTAYTEANLLGHSAEGLVPINHRCHREIEYTPGGDKRTLAEANAELADRAARAAGRRCTPAAGVPGLASSAIRPLYGKGKKR